MSPDSATIERLRGLLAELTLLTTEGKLKWEKQVRSAHRYARWNNNLLILGPNDAATADSRIPRYLFITPFDSPDCIEVNSNDEELGPAVLALTRAVEAATSAQQPTDPFDVTSDLLNRLKS